MNLTLPDRPYGGYIFDCDGTLTDNMPQHYQAWVRALGDFGAYFPEKLFYSWGGKPTSVIVAELNEKFGFTLDVDAMVKRKESYYWDLIPEVKPLAGVYDFALSLYGKAPIAVASGGHRYIVERTLTVLKIKDIFPVIVCAEDYVHGKPAPDPFLLAAELLGVPAEECVVFEDSPMGIQAATAAGMDHVFVPTGQWQPGTPTDE